MNQENFYTFIDAQNLNYGIKELGWNLDFKRFYVFLKDKYKIKKAYLFIGYKKGNEKLYTYLQEAGYICIFKPALELHNGKIKGNVDAELVLHSMIHRDDFSKMLLVTGDGDFYCLAEYMLKYNKLIKIIIPNKKRYSGLFKKLSSESNNIFHFIKHEKNKIMNY